MTENHKKKSTDPRSVLYIYFNHKALLAAHLCQDKAREEDGGGAEDDRKVGVERGPEAHPRDDGKACGNGDNTVCALHLMADKAQQEQAQHTAAED